MKSLNQVWSSRRSTGRNKVKKKVTRQLVSKASSYRQLVSKESRYRQLVSKESSYRQLLSKESSYRQLVSKESSYRQLLSKESSYRQLVSKESSYRQLLSKESSYRQLVSKESSYRQLVSKESSYRQLLSKESSYRQLLSKESSYRQLLSKALIFGSRRLCDFSVSSSIQLGFNSTVRPTRRFPASFTTKQNSLLRRRNGVLGYHRACQEGLSQDETSASEPKCTLSFNAKFCLMSGRDLVAPGTEIKSAPDVTRQLVSKASSYRQLVSKESRYRQLVSKESSYRQLLSKESSYRQLLSKESSYRQLVSKESSYRQVLSKESSYRQLVSKESSYRQLVSKESSYRQLLSKESSYRQLQNSLLRRRNGVLGRHRACREGLSQDETSASEPKCTLSFNAKRSRLPLTLASSLISGLTFALSTGSSKGRRPSCINHVTQFCLMSGRDLVAPGTEVKPAPDVEPVYRQTVITVCLPEGRANHSEDLCWFLSKGDK
ncbi:hypothetical protein RRG08_038387 [Elysia crispata]|uniref:Uncharacterized protein n=1 Tax=Elysia crispata TaxID=231223 RepID=A0AAE1DV26_9GAST|nr:hypothetical protein RRG08_038387 [Elysia crispata]